MAISNWINTYYTGSVTTVETSDMPIYVQWIHDTTPNYIHYKYEFINEESKRERKFKELKQRLMSESN